MSAIFTLLMTLLICTAPLNATSKDITTSVIITTYNRPDALSLVLVALDNQNVSGFEVIIADDGSKDETRETIEQLKSKVKYEITHVWQPDNGFRISMSRNKCAAIAKGDYLIFIDGDSVPSKSFIKRHRELAEEKYFVPGSRVMLPEKFTKEILNDSLPIYNFTKWSWFKLFCKRKIDRLVPFFKLKINFWRYWCKKKWKGSRTCNFALWKKDFFAVNGFDETYVGWGYDDADLSARLINNGIFRKEGRLSSFILHLYHPKASRAQKESNYNRFKETLNSEKIKSELGVDQYL